MSIWVLFGSFLLCCLFSPKGHIPKPQVCTSSPIWRAGHADFFVHLAQAKFPLKRTQGKLSWGGFSFIPFNALWVGKSRKILSMQSTHQTFGQRICFKTNPARGRGRRGWVMAECSARGNELRRLLGRIQQPQYFCLPTAQNRLWPGLLHCIITTKVREILIWQKDILDLCPNPSFSGVGRFSRNQTSLGFRQTHVPRGALEECFW